jgi:hypothetical protein
VSRSSDLGSVTRTLWRSSTASSSAISRNGNKSPSPAVASSPSATLADHLAKDGRSLSRHHSFAKDDADARKIGKGALGRSMRFLPSTKPAGSPASSRMSGSRGGGDAGHQR